MIEERTRRGALGLPRKVDAESAPLTQPVWEADLVVTCCILITVAVCLVDLSGWALHLKPLVQFFPGSSTLKANTALALLAFSGSIWLQRWQGDRGLRRNVAEVLAMAGGLIGLINLMEYGAGRFGDFDQMLFTDFSGSLDPPGRMSMATAAASVFLGLSLALLHHARRLSLLLLSVQAVTTLGAAIGFLYQVAPILGVKRFHSIAIATALLFLLLDVAVLCLRTDVEPLRSLSAPVMRENRARRLMVTALLLPPVLGFLLLRAADAHWFEIRFAMALLVTLLVVLQTYFVWRSAEALSRLAHVHRKAEDSLRRNEKLAVVGRLAATIAHEINNPLGSVSNLIYLSQHAATMEEVKSYLELAEEEMQRVSQITAQTLSFYREGSGLVETDIPALLDSAVFLLRSRITSAGADVVRQYEEGVAPLACSSGELRQVFINLMANALDAMPMGGRLLIRVRRVRSIGNQRQGLRVTVADNGSGIEEKHRAKLFEPFFTTKQETGNGLGLWVAHGIVERHGGTLRIRSSTRASASGTACSVYLPFPMTVKTTVLQSATR